MHETVNTAPRAEMGTHNGILRPAAPAVAPAAAAPRAFAAGPPPPPQQQTQQQQQQRAPPQPLRPQPPSPAHPAAAANGVSNINSSLSGNWEGPPAPMDAAAAAAALEEALRYAGDSFVQRLPAAWAMPLLRAVTVQAVTGRLPARVIQASAVLDALADMTGELQANMEAAAAEGSSSSHINTIGGGDSMGSLLSGASSPQLKSTTAAAMLMMASAAGDTTPHDQQQQLSSPFGPTVDLCRLLRDAPLLLRFRLNHLKEARVTEIISQYEVAAQQQQEQIEQAQQMGQQFPMPPPIVVPQRADVAVEVFRPVEYEVQFGAWLAAGVVRHMRPGARLFPSSGGATTSSSSGATVSGTVAVPTCATVSFESMPSLFLKAQHDARRAFEKLTPEQQQQQRGRSSSRRRRVNPFFDREFAAAFAIGGGPGPCLFATSLGPEFLVGLPAFLEDPGGAVASAIRATLHRMYMALTAELLANEAVLSLLDEQQQQHRGWIGETVRAPPVDMAVAYVRGNTLYCAATEGISGKVFYLRGSHGAARLVVDIAADFSHAGTGLAALAAEGNCDSGSGAPSGKRKSGGSTATTSNGSGDSGTFDMPAVRSGRCDLLQLSAAAAVVAAAAAAAHAEGEASDGSRQPSLPPPMVMPGVSAGLVPPLLPIILSRWTPQRLAEKARQEPTLPAAAVLAAAEFWDGMPTALVSDVLRVLLMLCRAAATYTVERGRQIRRVQRNNTTTTSGGEATAFTPFAAAAAAEAAAAAAADPTIVAIGAAQTSRVRAYIAGLGHCLDGPVRRRLAHFYDARVAFYTELDGRNAQSMQDKFHQQLAEMEQLRTTNHNHTTNIIPMHDHNNAGTLAADAAEAESSLLLAVDAAEAESSLLTKPLCDAIAATLTAMAVDRARAQQQQQLAPGGSRGGANTAAAHTAASTTPPTLPPLAVPPRPFSVVVVTLPELVVATPQ